MPNLMSAAATYVTTGIASVPNPTAIIITATVETASKGLKAFPATKPKVAVPSVSTGVTCCVTQISYKRIIGILV